MPDDRRLRHVAHWQDTVAMPVYDSLAAWQRRAAQIREQVLFAAGLLPIPEKTPLNPVVTGRLERDGYVIENVAFESFPGFYCTGNLYRPSGLASDTKVPVVLTPHGHWQEGRFVQRAEGSVPARCINFARQGYITFAPDMAGYNDSRQVEHRTFDNPRNELWGLGVLGLQLWNNIRALDYLLSLPGADATRVGLTGESGGATQAYLLAAVDGRPTVLAPVNMLSAHYAGGCVCENAPGLRHDLTNMEIIAAAAPRPQLIVAATGDWTVNVPRVEFPAVQTVYRLFDAEDTLECAQFEAPHNFNLASREAVYGFFARYLGGKGNLAAHAPSAVFRHGPSTPLAETPGSTIEDVAPLRVYPPGAPAPAPLDTATTPQRRSPTPELGVYQLAVGALLPAESDLTINALRASSDDSNVPELKRLEIGTRRRGERIPALHLPSPGGATDVPVLLVHSSGARHWIDGTTCSPAVQALIDTRRAVLAIDPFLTGSYLSPNGTSGRPSSETHFAGFNRSDVAWRAQDILTGVATLRKLTGAGHVDVVASGDAGLWAILARPLADGVIRRLVADCGGFHWNDEGDYLERLYVPHLLRLGGLETAVALSAPQHLHLFNTKQREPLGLRDIYASLGAAGSFTCEPGPAVDITLQPLS